MVKPVTRQRTKAKPTTPARTEAIPKSPAGRSRKGKDGGASDSSVASSTSSRPGVKSFVLKQLLQDIESASFGGIVSLQKKGEDDHYLLAGLLNERNEPNGDNPLYGAAASLKRRKLQKYVDRWKAYSREKYLELLAQYGVRAWSVKRRSIASKGKPKEDISDISESGSLDAEDIPQEIQTSAARPKKETQKKKKEAAPTPRPVIKMSSRSSLDLPRDTRKSSLLTVL